MSNRKNGRLMQFYDNPKPSDWDKILMRPTASLRSLEPQVQAIFEEVQTKGDQALIDYTQQFDQVSLTSVEISQERLTELAQKIDPELATAIDQAAKNIEIFHAAQKTSKVSVETQTGVHCWQEKRPIEKVGLYIPGGTAPLFSTLLMLAIPAKIAGCSKIVLCTPPNEDGTIPTEVAYIALKQGVDQVFSLGGVQAIGALTFGTETVPQVDKIFGPGNQYVTVAKQLATQYKVAIDMPAGPSEVLVMADRSADPSFVAADLLSQAEHGIDSQVILVSTDQEFIEATQQQLELQLLDLPRKSIAEKALANSKAIYFDSDEAAIACINAYGPEHYILAVSNEDLYLDQLAHAGSVFIGNYTPESAGDYASGTNHTLPTNGYVRQYSGVHLDSFLKAITFQKISAQGLQDLGPVIEKMAAAEGLEAHKKAVSIRLQKLNAQA